MAAAAAGDGRYRLAGVDVDVRDGVARGPAGELAGSVLTMLQAVRNLHALGASLPDAIAAATSVPARAGRLSGVGVLSEGGAGRCGRARRPARDSQCHRRGRGSRGCLGLK